MTHKRGGVFMISFQTIVVDTLRTMQAAIARELEIPTDAVRASIIPVASQPWRFWKKDKLVVDVEVVFDNLSRDALRRVAPDLRFWSMTTDEVDKVLRTHIQAANGILTERVADAHARR